MRERAQHKRGLWLQQQHLKPEQRSYWQVERKWEQRWQQQRLKPGDRAED